MRKDQRNSNSRHLSWCAGSCFLGHIFNQWVWSWELSKQWCRSIRVTLLGPLPLCFCFFVFLFCFFGCRLFAAIVCPYGCHALIAIFTTLCGSNLASQASVICIFTCVSCFWWFSRFEEAELSWLYHLEIENSVKFWNANFVEVCG